MLNAEQRKRATEVMREWLNAPPNPDGKTPFELQMALDQSRVELINTELDPLLKSYLAGQLPLSEFKSEVDGINKRKEFWGFKGIKGQMFFNMLTNVASDMAECDQEIKSALALPANEDLARSRIRTFAAFVRRLGEEFVEAGGTKHGRPKVGSIPFFLSYFWQIQDRAVWPVYYTNSVNVMGDLNLWQPTEDLADDYLAFKHIHEELAVLFSEASGKKFDLYMVEHVFWFKGGNPIGGIKPLKAPAPEEVSDDHTSQVDAAAPPSHLPESYVPPIVAMLPRIARNEAGMDAAAKASGTNLPKAFEKSIHAAFTILGFDTKLLGQGMGRVPDGLAIDQDNSYAILWDAKVRENGYSMGTDDRVIREYLMTQSRDLKRKKSLRNIYYVIVSSSFKDDFDDLIRTLKMDTDTNEVCMLEADALVAMVEAKLRNPLSVSLGPDGLQRLFCASVIISAEQVMENL